MNTTWGRFFAFCILLLGVITRPGGAQISTSDWGADLDVLAERLLAEHPNFYTKHSVEDFEDALESLTGKLDELDDEQIVMAISRVVALGGDSHTNVNAGAIGRRMRRLPMQLVVLSDGVFINAATQSQQRLIGRRVVSINGVAINEVLDRLGELFAYENESKRILTAAGYAVLLPALRSTYVIDDHHADTLPVTVEHEGERETLKLPCAPQARNQDWVSFIQLLPQPWPLAYRKQRGYYASDFVAEHKAMYVAYNSCREAPDLPMKDFVEFIMSKSEELDAQRIIIDMRFNGGGNETVIWPLWEALEQSDRFGDKGDVIGLISRQTFSSAMSNSHQLRNRCGAVLMGEPTGGKPNHFGELSSFTLPNSGITMYHSTKWFQKVEGDPDAVHPDVLVPWISADLFGGHDATLEAALNYTPE